MKHSFTSDYFKNMVHKTALLSVILLVILPGCIKKQGPGRTTTDSIIREVHSIMLSVKTNPDIADSEITDINNQLRTSILSLAESIEMADLTTISNQLNLEGIYIINTNGIVVNASVEQDLGLNLFAFGQEYKQFLQSVFADGKHHIERRKTGNVTGALQTFSYQATKDRNYIIQFSMEVPEGQDLNTNAHVKNQIQEVAIQYNNIEQVDLYFKQDAGTPTGFTSGKPLPEACLSEYVRIIREPNRTGSIRVTTDVGNTIIYTLRYVRLTGCPLGEEAVVLIAS